MVGRGEFCPWISTPDVKAAPYDGWREAEPAEPRGVDGTRDRCGKDYDIVQICIVPEAWQPRRIGRARVRQRHEGDEAREDQPYEWKLLHTCRLQGIDPNSHASRCTLAPPGLRVGRCKVEGRRGLSQAAQQLCRLDDRCALARYWPGPFPAVILALSHPNA